MKETILSSLAEHDSITRLERIYDEAPVRTLEDSDRIVIFSDMHIGNRRRGDDFRSNSGLFIRALEEYYWPRGFTLVLNGDIEELQKFNMPIIQRQWKKVFALFERFQAAGRLIKIIGNHDLELSTGRFGGINSDLLEALRLEYRGQSIFLLHGHQAGDIYHRYNDFVGFLAKYIAYPLGIANRTAAHDSKRRYTVERRIYRFSYLKQVISIIGHTHRPLFEGLSKRDSIRFSIERILRDYSMMKSRDQENARETIRKLTHELNNLKRKERKSPDSSFYHEADIVLPTLFNSGCVIGKRGITGIELKDGAITLIHWFDESKRKSYLKGTPTGQLPETTFHRRIIKTDKLEYIINSITLLGWAEDREKR